MTEVFYVSGVAAKGYTSNPEYAKRDMTGAPIISPGHMKKLLDDRDKDMRRAVERIWTALMDTMEDEYAARDAEDYEVAQNNRISGYGLIMALAILNCNGNFDDIEAEAEKIIEEAKERYEKESE